MKTNSMMSIDDALDAKFNELVVSCMKSGAIDLNLYQEYDVKRGLRDSNGKGVLTGLTEISDVTGYRVVDGVKEPADGMLYYQGSVSYTHLLLESYEANKERYEGDKKRAMAHAISNTFTSITASSITTVAGFVALCFMTFKLGTNIGIVMSKGVVIGRCV